MAKGKRSGEQAEQTAVDTNAGEHAGAESVGTVATAELPPVTPEQAQAEIERTRNNARTADEQTRSNGDNGGAEKKERKRPDRTSNPNVYLWVGRERGTGTLVILGEEETFRRALKQKQTIYAAARMHFDGLTLFRAKPVPQSAPPITRKRKAK